jgi:predicted AAA+ superfamily ATPase
MVRVLRPRLVNAKKRLVKSPNVYVRDTGLLHALLDMRTGNDLFGHIEVGSSWESYVVEQVCTALPDWYPMGQETLVCTPDVLVGMLRQ